MSGSRLTCERKARTFRRLISSTTVVKRSSHRPLEGEAGFSADVLYQIHYVDEEELRLRIRKMLQETRQTTLLEICTQFPLEKGLSELLTYLNLASKGENADIDDQVRDIFLWEDKRGCFKKAWVPRVIFTREADS